MNNYCDSDSEKRISLCDTEEGLAEPDTPDGEMHIHLPSSRVSQTFRLVGPPGSLESQVSGQATTGSNPPYIAANSNSPASGLFYRDRVKRVTARGPAPDEERASERLGNSTCTAPANRGRGSTDESDNALQLAAVTFSSQQRIYHQRCARRDADGGVRLEGGRPGEPLALPTDEYDQRSMAESEESTLPPSYCSHFRDT